MDPSDCNKLFQLTFSPKLGRHLIAGRDIDEGEVIIDEPAVVEGPSSLSLTCTDRPVCPVCYRRIMETVQLCPACQLSLCSTACSRERLHKDNECRLFSKCRSLRSSLGQIPKDLYNFITTCRALFLKSRDQLKWDQIMQLESMAGILEKEQPSLFQQIDQALNLLAWEDFDCSDAETGVSLITAAHHCLGVLRTNAFSEFTEFKGREGLYFFSSFMAHSCVMNTGRQFETEGSHVIVRAATRIPKGQTITNTYLSYFSNTREREKELKAGWGFRCDCSRCESLTEMDTFLGSINCPKCLNLTLSPLTKPKNQEENIWKCATESCGKEFSESHIDLILKAVQNIQESVPNLENIGNVEQWLDTSVRCGLLHPNHSTFTQIKLFLCQSYGKQEGLEFLSTERLLRKASYCDDVLKIVDKLYLGIYLFKGILLICLVCLYDMRLSQ